MPNDESSTNETAPANFDGSTAGNQPSYVTPDQLNQAISQMTQVMQTSLQAIAAGRNSDPTVHQAPTVVNLPTEAEILEEIQAGGMGKLKKFIEGAVDKVRREEIIPFKQQGVAALAQNTKQAALMSGIMPHYKRFQKEIDAGLEKIPPEQRTSLEVYKGMHDLVVGQNTDSIIREQVEAAIRAAREKDNTSLPGSTGGRQPNAANNDPNRIPAFEEIYGDNGKLALSNLGRGGRTPDGFAQSLGYKDWPTYYTEVLKPAGVTGNV